jgi:threonylcarbamoyladenosine tRNA methylthiotransferase MtaB
MKVFLHTFGCKVNQYETQLIREQFDSNNIKSVDNFLDADICVINSCTVTHNADSDCRQIIRRILKTNKKTRIIVTGCYAKISPEEIKKISPEIEIILDKNKIIEYLGIGKVYTEEHFYRPKNSLITYFYKHSRAFIKIQDGCDAYCSYCIVPYVRRNLWSKPKEDVLEEIQNLVLNNYREIVLCGIRLGKYKIKNYGLIDLIKDIFKYYPNLKIELSSIELKEINNELISIFNIYPNFVRHLHIPLQSGDNFILKLMRRNYTTEEYIEKISEIRKKIPDIRLTTDVIVGFPGETEEHFMNTYNFIKKIKFDKLHVFRFSKRGKINLNYIGSEQNANEVKNRIKLLNNLVN